jgi:ornithine cyclodeaminase
MPGSLSKTNYFGVKVVCVGPDTETAHQRHRGYVLLFSPEGAPLCLADAEEVTAKRTAAATAVATDALARSDASRLLIMGSGLQARAHIDALTAARSYSEIRVWGHTHSRACDLAAQLRSELSLNIWPEPDAERAVRSSDVICTLTSAAQPILFGSWVTPGAHVNLVGSKIAGPVEADSELVRMARYFVDSRPSALHQAAELLATMKDGLVDERHICAEIGAVLEGREPGRQSPSDVTIYKSLGHIVQDLAVVHHLHARVLELGATSSPFLTIV